jgi:RNA polymerase sigma-70 factor (ECF subfamily)
MESDERLLERLRAGDLGAFDRLYERYERPLYGFLLRLLRSPAEAEECFHDAFMALLRHRDGWVPYRPGSLRGWLYRAARNAALNRLRSRGRGRAAAALERAEPTYALPTPEERLCASEAARALAEAARRLPVDLAEVYQLRVAGLSLGEMAQALEVPIGTVKSRLSGAVSRLREEMKRWTAD